MGDDTGPCDTTTDPSQSTPSDEGLEGRYLQPLTAEEERYLVFNDRNLLPFPLDSSSSEDESSEDELPPEANGNGS